MDKLFEKFERTTDKSLWRVEVEKDLKGKPLEKLFWRTYEGFTLENYYKGEDIKGIDHLGTLPGKAPYLRGSKTIDQKNDWSICQEISNSNVDEANSYIKRALNIGVESITLRFDDRIKSGMLKSSNTATGINFRGYEDFKKIFDGVYVEAVGINFNSGKMSKEIFSFYKRLLEERNLPLSEIKGSIDNEPIRELAFIGEFSNLDERVDETAEIINELKENPNFKAINICLNKYHESGANSSQEIAIALATFVEYAKRLEGKVELEDLLNSLKFTFSTGQYYLMEVAKYRAFRYLFNKVVKELGVSEELGKTYIHAQTSKFTMSKFDPNVNMLRGTTQAMSSVIGGVDELTVLPFDIVTNEPKEFSYRIAKNIQLMMKEECHFDTIVDPAGGSYFIEKTTAKLIEESWKTFISIQDNGGIVKSILDGTIKNDILAVKAKREKNLSGRRDIYVGTNQYPNILEILPEKEEITFSYNDEDEIVKSSKRYHTESSDNTLKPYRATELFENIRIRTEENTKKTGKRITVFLATLGNLTMRKARATFSMGFLGSAGFDIIDNNGFKSVEDAFENFKKSGAEIIVICSSDDEYKEIAPELTKMTKDDNKENIVILAGYPKDLIEELEKAGVDHFIHIKANAKDVLTKIQDQLFK
ncbi:MAG: hypothetical protein CR982_03535 [Candidatus Cloacimonadota bacterium]|nr:MAG: hypothetical protein CR982_03535 [Candidatus Cloacimonadota bacterium]PIE78316.1 MAG: hypothetical protein CSA15_08470 [Candidatus Delongbacteria bacterium]